MALPLCVPVQELSSARTEFSFDALILVFADLTQIPDPDLQQHIKQIAAFDQRIGKETVLLHTALAPGQRLILAPVGILHRDFDDVRSFADAAKQAIVLAKSAGAVQPLVWVQNTGHTAFVKATEVVYLAMTQALWQPLEGREALGEHVVEPLKQIGMVGIDQQQSQVPLRKQHRVRAGEAQRLMTEALDGERPMLNVRSRGIHCGGREFTSQEIEHLYLDLSRGPNEWSQRLARDTFLKLGSESEFDPVAVWLQNLRTEP